MSYMTEDDLHRLESCIEVDLRQIAQLRGTPYAIREELKKASVLAARNVIERQFPIKPARVTTRFCAAGI